MQRRSAQPATLLPVIIADGAGGSCEFRKFCRKFWAGLKKEAWGEERQASNWRRCLASQARQGLE